MTKVPIGSDCLFSSNFYSHIPCGMWPSILIGDLAKLLISTHTSRVGCDARASTNLTGGSIFLLTHPVWDVTQDGGEADVTYDNFYSHIPCGMWLYRRLLYHNYVQISTHTSRVGCDKILRLLHLFLRHFYSHIPCGMWQEIPEQVIRQKRFLLTHPVWDVTTN